MPCQHWLRYSLLGLALCTPSSFAQSGTCLADVNAAASGDIGYRARGARCEGMLKLFVSNTPRIELVGYHYGKIALPPAGASVAIQALGDKPNGQIAIRALRLTSRGWYQMDRANTTLGTVFPWPADVLVRAAGMRGDAALDLSATSLIACSNRCAERPDTLYWPIEIAGKRPDPPLLYLLLRSGVRATRVTVELAPARGAAIPVPADKAVLTADGVTAIALPANLAPGTYRLAVTAVDFSSDEALDALDATIAVPRLPR